MREMRKGREREGEKDTEKRELLIKLYTCTCIQCIVTCAHLAIYMYIQMYMYAYCIMSYVTTDLV